MRVELIPQVEIGNIQRMRVGDVLNTQIADSSCERFRFAVAYMRLSGWDRIAGAVDTLLNRGGRVSGIVGVDSGVTTIEALRALRQVSQDSTVFYTRSAFIYHPKLYLMNGRETAVAIVGSPNLTRDGLFRNVELSTAVRMNFTSSVDLQVFNRYSALFDELLNTERPNVQPITDATLEALITARLIDQEARVREPGHKVPFGRGKPTPHAMAELDRLFPPMRVPVAPAPTRAVALVPVRPQLVVVPPQTVGIAGTFVMQLSAFDCSHRTGVPGTPEVLVPHQSVHFFPPLSLSGRRYPDAMFDVLLNTPTGQERHRYRLWYYEERATGTRIDEYRLRMNHDTIDLASQGGGDLLVITKRPQQAEPAYEVTILPRTDPTFPAFFSLCVNEAQGKRWGIA